MPFPTISDLPPAPSRTMTNDEFIAAADTFVAALATLVSQINTWATYTATLAASLGVSEADPQLLALADMTLDTDTTLAANSDTRLATQKAVKSYVDAHVAYVALNFDADGDEYFYANHAITMTELATRGTGSVAYSTSLTGVDGSFTSASSPITLSIGTWLKISATGVSPTFAVALEGS